MKHLTYEQKYLSIPVFGSQMIIHLNKDLSVKSANGKMIPKISLNTKPQILEAKAVELAKKYWNDQFNSASVETTKTKLYIFNEKTVNPTGTDKNYLAWQVDLVDYSILENQTFFIDAKNGNLLYQINKIKTSFDRRIYDCSSGTCTLARTEIQPVTGIADVDSLFTMLGDSIKYYHDKFNLDGANGLGGIGAAGNTNHPTGKTDGYTYVTNATTPVSFDCPFNAMWLGESVGAIGLCQNMVVRKVVGHEYTHAVNGFQGPNFVYSGESGAVEEGLCDVFGAAIDNYKVPNADWDAEVGGAVFRDIDNPLSSGHPDTYFAANYYCGNDQDKFVHDNSTVISHAAYIMATGGNFNNCSIKGIGREKTEQILYRAITNYMTKATTFNDSYYAINDACEDLYPFSIKSSKKTNTCAEVRKAMQSVYMNQAWGTCGGANPNEATCTAPYANSVFSHSPDKTYSIGDSIKIGVSFSKPVTSSSITLELNVGNNRTCSLSIDNDIDGFCTYVVQEDDYSTDLDVTKISGTIKDENGVQVTNFTPVHKLSDNNDISVNGTAFTIDEDIFDIDTDDDDADIPIDIPIDIPPVEIPIDTGDRKPSFDVTVTNDGLATYTVTGKINYYGTYKGCEGPRYFDPVVIGWGQVDSILTPTGPDFTATHKYVVKNPEYDLVVSVTNSCFQSTRKHFTVTPHL